MKTILNDTKKQHINRLKSLNGIKKSHERTGDEQ